MPYRATHLNGAPPRPAGPPASPRSLDGLVPVMIVLSSLVALSQVLGTVPAAATAAGWVSVLQLPNWIITGRWLARARANAVLVAPRDDRLGPAWCWLGWVFPVVNWWFPKQLVDDAWRSADPDASGGPVPTRLWWGLWLAHLFLGYVTMGLALAHRTDSGAGLGLKVVAAVVAAVVLVAWIRVVRGLTRAQGRLIAN